MLVTCFFFIVLCWTILIPGVCDVRPDSVGHLIGGEIQFNGYLDHLRFFFPSNEQRALRDWIILFIGGQYNS